MKQVWLVGALHPDFGFESVRVITTTEHGATLLAEAIARSIGQGWRPYVRARGVHPWKRLK
jgi:adenine/guanine phosphoribosyltransferase-like PRPP-binding protein